VRQDFHDFAHVVKRETPRKRHFHERDEHGKRKTVRRYRLPDPNVVVRRRPHASKNRRGVAIGPQVVMLLRT